MLPPAQTHTRLVLSTAGPYERQLAVEALRRAVRRWGAARVRVGRTTLDLRLAASPRMTCVCGATGALVHCEQTHGERCLTCLAREWLHDHAAGLRIESPAVVDGSRSADPIGATGSHRPAARPSQVRAHSALRGTASSSK